MKNITEEKPTKQHSMKCPKLYGQDCKCDGYHTFDELYEHRITLFIQICKMVIDKDRFSNAHSNRQRKVWRSKLHSDGTNFEGWFILGINEKQGEQITYHLPLSKWKETDFAFTEMKAPEWDGHTSDDVIKRLKTL